MPFCGTCLAIPISVVKQKKRSPFLVSDERSPKMKERSPFAANTKYYDDCTKSDRHFLFLMSDRLK
ncbi:hypothetical protein [Microcoleus sp.]|uniref:hypothetical protein n=1 Tax=Microcoleus sp. TaxID=44472 RepID=UPI0035239A21